MSDLVAVWDVSLADKVHKVEFEHGTTTGKRVISVDGKNVKREEWMFKLVGRENFSIGKAKCTISIEAVTGFAYEYSLEVNGKSLKKFTENQNKIIKAWVVPVDDVRIRVALDKGSMDVWVNENVVETIAQFTDEGVETHFVVGDAHSAFIRAESTGKKKTGIVHKLFVDNNECSTSE